MVIGKKRNKKIGEEKSIIAYYYINKQALSPEENYGLFYGKIYARLKILRDLPAMLRKAMQAGRLIMFYYTYVLKSKKDKDLYIGWTDDLKNRIETHNKGKVDATKYRLPMELVYFEGCAIKELAIKREKQLKSGFGRAYLKRRLK